jgi:TolA-binding protein
VYPIKRGIGAIEDRLDRMEESIERLARGQSDLKRRERKRKDRSETPAEHLSQSNRRQVYGRGDDGQSDGPMRMQGRRDSADGQHQHSNGDERGRNDDSQPPPSTRSPAGKLGSKGDIDRWTNPVQRHATSSASLHDLTTVSTGLRPRPPRDSSSVRGQNGTGSGTDGMRVRLAANANK